jgi:hypothetical protein
MLDDDFDKVADEREALLPNRSAQSSGLRDASKRLIQISWRSLPSQSSAF